MQLHFKMCFCQNTHFPIIYLLGDEVKRTVLWFVPLNNLILRDSAALQQSCQIDLCYISYKVGFTLWHFYRRELWVLNNLIHGVHHGRLCSIFGVYVFILYYVFATLNASAIIESYSSIYIGLVKRPKCTERACGPRLRGIIWNQEMKAVSGLMVIPQWS